MGRVEEEAEVDELLRAAEDHHLLNLQVDAHTTAASFDSDFARRFQALKSPSSSANPRLPSSKPADRGGGTDGDEELRRILGDNLAARFVALKGPLAPAESGTTQQSVPIPNNHDEDEVEKVMQWAMDVARLNPSKSHDNDDDDEEEEDDEEEDEEEVKEEKIRASSSSKGKGKPRRWFF